MRKIIILLVGIYSAPVFAADLKTTDQTTMYLSCNNKMICDSVKKRINNIQMTRLVLTKESADAVVIIDNDESTIITKRYADAESQYSTTYAYKVTIHVYDSSGNKLMQDFDQKASITIDNGDPDSYYYGYQPIDIQNNLFNMGYGIVQQILSRASYYTPIKFPYKTVYLPCLELKTKGEMCLLLKDKITKLDLAKIVDKKYLADLTIEISQNKDKKSFSWDKDDGSRYSTGIIAKLYNKEGKQIGKDIYATSTMVIKYNQQLYAPDFRDEYTMLGGGANNFDYVNFNVISILVRNIMNSK